MVNEAIPSDLNSPTGGPISESSGSAATTEAATQSATQAVIQETAPTATETSDEQPPVAAMRHGATSCDMERTFYPPSLPSGSSDIANRLTPQQQTAISLLIVGRSTLSIAATLGVHRSTIARWRHQHPLFAAELARQQRDVFDTASRRLRLLMVKAISIVEGSLRAKYNKETAAWKVLTGLRAAQWASLPAPVEAEQNEWIDEAATTPATSFAVNAAAK